MYAKILPLILIGLSLTACSFRPTLPKQKSFTSDLVKSYVETNAQIIGVYQASAMTLEANEWGSGEVELVGGTLGAAGVVASSIPIAAGGAALFGSSELVSTFYGYEKQSDAYMRAYHAASCLQTIAYSLKPTLFEAVDVPPGWVSVEAYAVHHLNSASEKVHNRLFESLRKRAVSQPPDFNAFQASLQASMKSAPAPAANGFTGNLTAAHEAQLQALGRLETNIALCLAL